MTISLEISLVDQFAIALSEPAYPI